MKISGIIALAAVSSAITISASGGSRIHDSGVCDVIRLSLRNNIDTIVRVEMVNFKLKEDEAYRKKFSNYYDDALSTYDTKTLLRAIESVSRICPF